MIQSQKIEGWIGTDRDKGKRIRERMSEGEGENFRKLKTRVIRRASEREGRNNSSGEIDI